MDGRIVISFRAAATGFLERARALRTTASAAGAVVVAWDATKITFALEDPTLEKSIALATAPAPGHGAWAIGIAQGVLEPLGRTAAESAWTLGWGPPLVAASLLASAARPGEILCAETLRAVRSGALLTHGSRLARDGDLRVRGARVDPQTPWRRDAVAQLARLRVAPLVGAVGTIGTARHPEELAVAPGGLSVVRADPGTGGSRMLTELAANTPRVLVVSPSGSGMEPLGALRHALARSISRALSPRLMDMAEHVERLLMGEGVSIDIAARLVSAYLWPKTSAGALGALLIDDAKDVDPSSLEACVRAARGAASFGLVARLDATGSPPPVLAAMPRTSELELGPLTAPASEELVAGCTSGAVDPVARRRWARLGGGVPLAVIEALAWGIASGELVYRSERAEPRVRTSGRGRVRAAADWIKLRAADESDDARALLCLLGLLGGEAKASRLTRILEAAGRRIDVEDVASELVGSRWLIDTEEAAIALPSRTHQAALGAILEEDAKKVLHRAAADVIADEEGTFGRVESGWHAAQAGDASGAAATLLAAARATAKGGLEASTTQLIAFARRIDPACEAQALELLSSALAQAPGVEAARRPKPPLVRMLPTPIAKPPPVPPPPVPARRPSVPAPIASRPPPPPATFASEEPDSMLEHAIIVGPDQTSSARSVHAMVKAGAAPAPAPAIEPPTPSELPGAVRSGTNIATRLGELAKEALLGGDNVSLERWVDGLRAAGESPVFTERMRAMARIVRGDIGDALRVLRRTREKLDPTEHALRCQTSLAMGIALSVAGRPQEALLEGLDALARARQTGDARAADACVAFLAKLFQSVGRAHEAAMLRSITP